MPSDSEIRNRFHEGTQPKGQIDVDAVLRRARARRRPRIAVAAAGSVLAIAAIAVPATFGSYLAGGAQDTALVAGGDSAAPEFATDGGGSADTQSPQSARISAESLNLCGAPVAEIPPAESGLVITVRAVTASATSREIPVTVTLTNGGSERIDGTTGSRPALTLSRDGITLWHTNGPQDLLARVVALDPGDSMTYETTFEPLVCGAEDDALESFRTDLPAAGPGEYLLSAAIDVTHDDGSLTELATGPATTITLT